MGVHWHWRLERDVYRHWPIVTNDCYKQNCYRSLFYIIQPKPSLAKLGHRHMFQSLIEYSLENQTLFLYCSGRVFYVSHHVCIGAWRFVSRMAFTPTLASSKNDRDYVLILYNLWWWQDSRGVRLTLSFHKWQFANQSSFYSCSAWDPY